MNRPCLPTILAASPTGLEFDGAPALAAPRPDSNDDVADRTIPLVATKAARARPLPRPLSRRFTRDEQLLMLTAWTCARSPLILGNDLRRLDDWTLRLVTNPEVLVLLRAPGARAHGADGFSLVSSTADRIIIGRAATEPQLFSPIDSAPNQSRFDGFGADPAARSRRSSTASHVQRIPLVSRQPAKPGPQGLVLNLPPKSVVVLAM